MTRLQWITIAISVGLFSLLYLGFDTKAPKQKSFEKSRLLSAESANIEMMLRTAKQALAAPQSNAILAIETQLESAFPDSAKALVLQQLSGKWYDFGQPAIAGHYAENVAQITGTEEAWSIAGTTYTLCVQRSEEQRIKDYCTNHAVQAFENAISINPDNIAHKVNLALCYTENPPQDNPMRGILMLVELNKDFPDNVLVLNNLGRLAITTGQFDRAVQRLEKALSLESNNATSICLLSRAYDGVGQKEKAKQFAEACSKLMN